MLEPYQMLLVFYRWWELHMDASFYISLDPSWFIIWQLSFYPVHDDCIIGIISSSHKCHDQSHHLHYLIIEWRLYYLYHSIYKCHDHFIICLILALSAMMNLSFASFGIIVCIIPSLPWHSRHLHYPIITSAFIHCHFLIVKNMKQGFLLASSLCLPYLHFRSASCWKIPLSSQGPSDCFTITNHPTLSLFELCWDVWEIKLTL